ncbi:hypothetical protein GV828_00550 [Flavobacterium sp. NST-5]|uniref:Tox-MPTase2 domain-containing protein n=1 Tax=Flavobacterium ichthyis TaxID=2698827 RepID=A0ABW9Z549_9FLAO|nr:RHS repeat-associated core domain-containing protein [Flavobacterium ichthyis]NBL63682.1 hypothetical protein [Flavobacterium ichthyis]
MAEQHSFTEDYANPFKFNGKELDEETGMYYYGARYYDPKISIWMSVDPLAEQFPEWNPYNYCMQNPVKYVDPNGKAPLDIIYVNSVGNVYKVVKDGSSAITINDGGKIKSISDYQISKNSNWFDNNNRNRQVVASIASYYGSKRGIKNIGATYEMSGLAHYDPKNKNIYISPSESNGGSSKFFNDLNNLTNVLVHENKHRKDHADGIETSYITHAEVYLFQMSDSSFQNTTPDFAESTMESFVNYLKSADYYKEAGSNNLIESFNKLNIKGGYRMEKSSGSIHLYDPKGNEVWIEMTEIMKDPH